MLSGDNGILQKATDVRELTGIAKVVENAKLDILAQIAENKGEDISKDQLKTILNKYFENISTLELPDNLSNSDIKLNANQTYGGYQNIALVDIYNGKFTTEQNPVQVINYEDSFVGCYADIDGNGSIDGIIYADLLVGSPSSGSYSTNEDYPGVTYTLPTDVTSSNVKNYVKSDTAVVDERFDLTARYIISLSKSSSGTKNRFYVLNLEDVTDYLNSPLISEGWTLTNKEQWTMFAESFELKLGESDSLHGLKPAFTYLVADSQDWVFDTFWIACYDGGEADNWYDSPARLTYEY